MRSRTRSAVSGASQHHPCQTSVLAVLAGRVPRPGAGGPAATSRRRILPRSMAMTDTRNRPLPRGYDKDRAQLLRRLARMEGQVRGIARMVEREEYCIDILQQTAALRAAVDSVTL